MCKCKSCSFFLVLFSNTDGQIDAGEYNLFFIIIGVDPQHANESLKAIDTNKDGRLSLDEFKTAGLDFFMAEDGTSLSYLFWGPLV